MDPRVSKVLRNGAIAAIVFVGTCLLFVKPDHLPSKPALPQTKSTQVAARPTESSPLSGTPKTPPKTNGTVLASFDCHLDIAFIDKPTGYPLPASGDWYLVSDTGQMTNVFQWPGGVKDQPTGPGAHINAPVPCTWSGRLYYGNVPGYLPAQPFQYTDLSGDSLRNAFKNSADHTYRQKILLSPLPPPSTRIVVVTATPRPTQTPTLVPTLTPTMAPSMTPTAIPSPTVAPSPTQVPTLAPTETSTPSPTIMPTLAPAYGDFGSCVVRDSQTHQPIAGAQFKIVLPKLDSVSFGTTNANGQLSGTAMNGAEGFLVIFAPPVYQTISDPSFAIVDGKVELNGKPGCDIYLATHIQPASASVQSNVYPNGCTQVDDECHQTAILRSYPEAISVSGCRPVTGYVAPPGTQVGYRGINEDSGSIFLRQIATPSGEIFDGWTCNVELRSGESVQVGLSRVCANIYLFPGTPTSFQADEGKQSSFFTSETPPPIQAAN